MLIKFNFMAGSDEWRAFRDAMFQKGHVLAIRYERSTPNDPRIVWPMGDHYISDKGEKCWPLVMFAAPPRAPMRRGYVLEGVAPLPVMPLEPAPPRAKSKARASRGERAARWFVAQNGTATRKEAAEKYGVSLPALSIALGTFGAAVPRGRNNSRSANAARWAAAHPEFTRYDVARLFELSYTSICNALRRFGIETPPCISDRTNEEIEALKRSLKP
jgi:hypothetical protein